MITRAARETVQLYYTISIRMKWRALLKTESALRLLKEILLLLLVLLRLRALLETLAVVVVMLFLLRRHEKDARLFM